MTKTQFGAVASAVLLLITRGAWAAGDETVVAGSIVLTANQGNAEAQTGVYIRGSGDAKSYLYIDNGEDNSGLIRMGTNTSSIYIDTTSIILGGASTITGQANINSTGTAATNIGTAGGATNIGSASSINTILGTTNSTGALNQTGVTSVNTSGDAATTLGNASSVVNLNGGNNNIGVNSFATTNNIGTGSAVSTNNIGNAQTATLVHIQGGNAQMNLANNTASLTVPGAIAGVSNGVAVTSSQLMMTGGNDNPTRMILNDNAATFSRVSNGAPITVTGVANGRNDFDAVNVRQFAGATAAVAAQGNVPALASGQDRTIGLGVASFMGAGGLALGMNMRDKNNAVYKLSISTGLNKGGTQTIIGAGAAWPF